MKIFIIFIFITTVSFATSEFETVKKPYFKSYDYEKMGQYAEAIKVLAPLYKKYPKGYTLNLRFGWLFYLDNKYNNALNHYKEASLINPSALAPRLGLINVYIITGKYNDAEQVAYELLKIDYYNYYANLAITKALIAQKKYDIAQKIAQKMLALYPTDVSFLEQLAIIYKKIDSPYLEKLYEDILILDPNSVLVHLNKK